MKTKTLITLILAVAAVTVALVILRPTRQTAAPAPESLETALSSVPAEMSETTRAEPASPRPVVVESEPSIAPEPSDQPVATTNKLERLRQIRETFRALAAGDPTTALRAAKQITDETERETALLTLVTEWTRGELGSPRRRAQLISTYGLEAGLGFELANKPELAVLWANELTEGPARNDLLQQIARGMVGADAAAAFALSQQTTEESRRKFTDALFADWATKDTSAALQRAEQLPDPAERDAAIAAIRSVAPVGIGAVLSSEDGYPVIRELVPGTPAELSGQIGPGDRIVGLAQGDSSFVDAHGVALADIVKMVRGAPGTLLQLQVLSANAPPNSPPRTVVIMRDQVKFKQ